VEPCEVTLTQLQRFVLDIGPLPRLQCYTTQTQAPIEYDMTVYLFCEVTSWKSSNSAASGICTVLPKQLGTPCLSTEAQCTFLYTEQEER
jgi:hypothetical protein